ncbi:aldolase [Methanocalculus taiwanensis]|uniref:Aldolase n=1 Tax=Methanocalculus taiwanensis TaxID=106207 RepID=A0ABD4TMS8_9EURY|nr:aldolase [Methanocalculus taiwanensis]MCQ1539499.1 aldolase [Methanocalculus taiwanensis]
MHNTDFKRIGQRLFNEGLVGGNFGNMSIRLDPGYLITRSGSYLDEPGELVPVIPGEPVRPETSSEYRVHEAIYGNTGHAAIVHAHPSCAVAASICMDRIIPIDSEGQMLCPEIAVVEGAPGTQELADMIAAALQSANLAIARGHGTFAAGRTLDEAYLYTSLAEHASRVLFYSKGF